MAEYIEREKLLELINEDCKYKNPTNEYTRGCNEVCDWAIKTIKNIPTADVVPKSEVEELKKDRYIISPDGRIELIPRTDIDEIKVKLAKEIFEELGKKSIYCAPSMLYTISKNDFAELKKKYTEDQSGG